VRGWSWLATLALGCRAGAYVCVDDASCKDGDRVGQCESSGGCSFPDPQCPSGRRYGAHAPAELAGECVPEDDVADTGTSTSTSTSGETTTGFTSTTGSAEVSSSGDTTHAIEGSESADTTTIASSTTTDPTTSTESTGGGTTNDPYGDCMIGGCAAGSECEPLGALPQTCAPPCDVDGDCPLPQGVDLVPNCVGQGNDKWCVLPCTDFVQCPQGMECTDWEQQQYGMLCTWF
jgi:hypothetical protein